MTRIKGQLTTADYLPYDEYLRLLGCLRKDKLYLWELYCCLGFCTALRCCDILSLKWSEILDKPVLIKIEKKTDKARLIKVNPDVEKKIRELYELLGKPDINSPVICNPHTGKAYRINRVNKLLKKFRREYKIKIRAFSTHTFRKTFGRYVYEFFGRSAEALILLNTIFKHSNIETTKRYIGLVQDEIDMVFDSIKF